jgi:sulfate/thiosulfate transport system permease protein
MITLTRPRASTAPRPRPALGRLGVPIGWGVVNIYVGLAVLVPLGSLLARAAHAGPADLWTAATAPQALSALGLTMLIVSAAVIINAVAGTALAWLLVRDSFAGQWLVNAVIDLPFALPTIVAGLTLLALYGPDSPVGINVAYTPAAVLLALLFVTLPFVVRAVQPVLIELDRPMEEAAATLGASPLIIFQRIILPSLLPALLSGMALAFARGMGEFGAVVLISGNIPFATEVASVFIFKRIESGQAVAALALAVVLLLVSLVVLLGTTTLQARRTCSAG